MSAGALDAFRLLVTALPRELPAAIVVAYHVRPPSILPTLIEAWTGRRVQPAVSGALLCTGDIHVCPPQHHVVVNPDGTLAISAKERVAYVRPSIDWLFESVAASYGTRGIGVLLSGANGDGARGAELLARAGGAVAVQSPRTCPRPEMPLAALATGAPISPVAPAKLGAFVARQVARCARPPNGMHGDSFSGAA